MYKSKEEDQTLPTISLLPYSDDMVQSAPPLNLPLFQLSQKHIPFQSLSMEFDQGNLRCRDIF